MPSDHPICNDYPLMDKDQYEAFKQDISRNGLRVPALLWNGQVIDGRHRLMACAELGIEPRFSEINCPEEELKALVDSLNEHRRHLTPSQRAMRAASESRASTRGGKRGEYVGKPQDTVNRPNGTITISTQVRAAKKHGISQRHVRRAASVLTENETLAKQVFDGKLTLQGAIRKIAKEHATHFDIESHVAKVGQAVSDPKNAYWQMYLNARIGVVQQELSMLASWRDERPAVPNQYSWELEKRLLAAMSELCELSARL